MQATQKTLAIAEFYHLFNYLSFEAASCRSKSLMAFGEKFVRANDDGDAVAIHVGAKRWADASEGDFDLSLDQLLNQRQDDASGCIVKVGDRAGFDYHPADRAGGAIYEGA